MQPQDDRVEFDEEETVPPRANYSPLPANYPPDDDYEPTENDKKLLEAVLQLLNMRDEEGLFSKNQRASKLYRVILEMSPDARARVSVLINKLLDEEKEERGAAHRSLEKMEKERSVLLESGLRGGEQNDDSIKIDGDEGEKEEKKEVKHKNSKNYVDLNDPSCWFRADARKYHFSGRETTPFSEQDPHHWNWFHGDWMTLSRWRADENNNLCYLTICSNKLYNNIFLTIFNK